MLFLDAFRGLLDSGDMALPAWPLTLPRFKLQGWFLRHYVQSVCSLGRVSRVLCSYEWTSVCKASGYEPGKPRPALKPRIYNPRPHAFAPWLTTPHRIASVDRLMLVQVVVCCLFLHSSLVSHVPLVDSEGLNCQLTICRR